MLTCKIFKLVEYNGGMSSFINIISEKLKYVRIQKYFNYTINDAFLVLKKSKEYQHIKYASRNTQNDVY